MMPQGQARQHVSTSEVNELVRPFSGDTRGVILAVCVAAMRATHVTYH